MTDFSLFLSAVDALGTLAVLTFLVLAFYRGDLIPKAILDRILKLYETQFEAFATRVLKRLDQALGSEDD